MVEQNYYVGREEALNEAIVIFLSTWDNDRFIKVVEEEELRDPAQFGNPPDPQVWSGIVRADGMTNIILCSCYNTYKFAVLRREDFAIMAHFNMTFDEVWRIVVGMREHFGG